MLAAFGSAASAVAACASPSQALEHSGGIAHEPRRLADWLPAELAILHLLAILALIPAYPGNTRDLEEIGDTCLLPRSGCLRMLMGEEAPALDLFPVDLCHELEVYKGLLLLALHDIRVPALVANVLPGTPSGAHGRTDDEQRFMLPLQS